MSIRKLLLKEGTVGWTGRTRPRMKKTPVQVISGLFGASLCLVTIWINFSALHEAYGTGAPYYSQTMNMDKWVDPVPYLVPMNLIVLGIAVISIRFSLKSSDSHD